MSLNDELIAAIQASWDEVCLDVRNNGVELFITFFTAFPTYKQYFKELRDVEIGDLRKNKALRIHATRVMHALSSMIQSLDELDVVAGIMCKTIDTHFDLDILSISQYEDVFSVLPDFMRKQAGEKFNSTAEEGWGLALGTLLSVARERIEELKEQKAASS